MDVSEVRFLEKVDPLKIKRCSKCNSVFINESACEVCGALFEKGLGPPLGEKSFFTLQEKYENEVRWMKYNPFYIDYKSQTFSEYGFSLKRRFFQLLRILKEEVVVSEADSKIYFLEMEQILQEMGAKKLLKGVYKQHLQLEMDRIIKTHPKAISKANDILLSIKEFAVAEKEPRVTDPLAFSRLILYLVILGGIALTFLFLPKLSGR
jgi:hypothetical protein